MPGWSDEPGSKAFDFAQDTTKQILTLASAIITVTVTFLLGDLKNVSSSAQTVIEIGWGVYVLSILFGVLTLLNLSGNLERPGDGKSPSIYAGSIRCFSALQVITFVIAVGVTIAFGVIAL